MCVSLAPHATPRQEAVSSMYRTSQEETLINDMSNFVCDIYCAKYQQMPICAHLWLQLGMSEPQIQVFLMPLPLPKPAIPLLRGLSAMGRARRVVRVYDASRRIVHTYA